MSKLSENFRYILGIPKTIYFNFKYFDFKYNRTIFRNTGEIIFKGKTKIGYGSVISNEGKLIIGENTNFTMIEFICRDKIEIGDKCLFSWNVSLMDTDHHRIFLNNNIINKSKGIEIGEHVWLGSDVKILKGVKIAKNNIIGSGSIITKSIERENVIVGNSIEVKILKENINWEE